MIPVLIGLTLIGSALGAVLLLIVPVKAIPVVVALAPAAATRGQASALSSRAVVVHRQTHSDRLCGIWSCLKSLALRHAVSTVAGRESVRDARVVLAARNSTRR
jgi:hypothetical protein